MKTNPNLYALDFCESDWNEIESLAFGPFVPDREGMSRSEWMAIANIALGKALRIEEGDFDMRDEDDRDNSNWAQQLRDIAHTILAEFRPGDGKV